MNKEHEFAAYVGLDWGDRRHSLHLQVAGERNAESLNLARCASKPGAKDQRVQGAKADVSTFPLPLGPLVPFASGVCVLSETSS
jgi:hypothetical protein